MPVGPVEIASEQVDSLVQVIELVRTGRARTKPELGRISGLGRSVVSQRLGQATDLGLVEEAELGPSTGGRAPRHLRFRAEAGSLASMAFGALHVGVGVYDLAGTELAATHQDWDITRGPEESLQRAVDPLGGLVADLDSRGPWWGVAVGLPGPVEFATARPVAPPIMPGWNGFDLRGWFADPRSERLPGVPVWADNDVNLMALGEWAETPDRDLAQILMVKVGSGIGAGLVSSGRVHRGANGAAGDIGHIAVSDQSTVICRCGQTGCLEAVAGGWALARGLEEAAGTGESPFLAERLQGRGMLLPSDIADGAQAGDATCVAAIGQSGRVVGDALAGLVSFYNPSRLVVGGTVAEAGDLFLAAVRQTVYRRSLPLATRELQIVPATLRQRGGLQGGYALLADRLFGNRMRAWLPAGTPAAAGEALYDPRLR